MGYACPVCGAPQSDATHLANHLAFTAMLHSDEHEPWLDERVPDWSDRGPAELAADVVGYAPETEYPQVFMDTVDDHDHSREHGQFEEEIARHGGYGRDSLDSETERVLAEAREMTEWRRSEDETAERDDEAETE